MKKAVAAAAIVMATAMPALAQDGVMHNWSGFYAGVYGDVGALESTWDTIYGTYEGGQNDVVPGTLANMHSIGGAIGATAGFNWQASPNFLLGIEGDIGATNFSSSDQCIGDQGYGATCSTNANWLGSLAARAGVTIDHTLVFGKAGLAFGNFTYDVGDFVGFTAPDYGAVTKTQTGLLLAAGVEHALNERVSVKGELNYMKFNSTRVDFSSGCGTGCYSSDFGTDISNSVVGVRIGINVKFP